MPSAGAGTGAAARALAVDVSLASGFDEVEELDFRQAELAMASNKQSRARRGEEDMELSGVPDVVGIAFGELIERLDVEQLISPI